MPKGRKPIITKEILIELHHNQRLSIQQIAEKLNVTGFGVRCAMERYDLKFVLSLEKEQEQQKRKEARLKARQKICIRQAGRILLSEIKENIQFYQNHALKRTRRIWQGMHARCKKPHNTNYRYYGAKGINVTSEWDNFENFVRDMGLAPPNLQIDRINSKENYSKNNCRWVTQTENLANRWGKL